MLTTPALAWVAVRTLLLDNYDFSAGVSGG